MLSIGLGLGLGGRSTSAALLDIATLNLSLWFRNYTSPHPWAGTASAGSSATPSLVNGNSPSAGATLNGRSTARYNGTTNYSDGSGTGSTSTTTASSNIVLFNASAAAADSGAVTTNPCILTSRASNQFAIDFSTGGCRFMLRDSGVKAVQIACGTAGWHLAQMKHNGTTLSARIDSGSWSSTACSTLGNVTYNFGVAQNVDNTLKFTGDIAAILRSPTAFSDAEFDQIKAALNAYYGLAL